MEYNLSVLNIRTQQSQLNFIFVLKLSWFFFLKVVDQMRPREKPSSKRPAFPTSIVTNVNLNSRSIKRQGRPISSVFITQDPVKIIFVFLLIETCF
jgi:hypothetical protein